MNLNKIFVFLFLFLSFLALSIYVFKEKKDPYIDKHFSLKENILEKTKETKKIEKNKKLRTLASKKDSEEKRTNTQAEKRKEKFGIKPIDGTYKSLSFSIADVSEEEINRWRVQDEEPEGFALSSLVLKVNKRALLENEKLQIPLNKKEFLELKRLDFDLTNEDSFVWQGSSDTKLDSKASSNVLLSWYKGHLTGYLNLSREESYQISYFKKNHIIIRKLNPSSFPKKQGSCILHENEKVVSNKNSLMYRDSFSLNLSKDALKRASETVGGKKIRILFLYRDNEYNINTIKSKVNSYISSLNAIFKKQDISQSLIFEKAGIEVTQYKERSLLDTLRKVGSSNKVEKLRHDYQADLISILVKRYHRDICGAANTVGGSYLVSAIACDYLYAFEHEVGHTLGASHEREQVKLDGHSPSSSYAYGYYESRRKTIMSYDCWRGSKTYDCKWVKYYSSSSPNFIGNYQNDVVRHIKNNLSSYKNRYESRYGNRINRKQPRITKNLNSIYKKSPGSTVTFSVSATGTNLSYQWYKDNQVLNGERSSTLSLTNLAISNAGKYKVKVSNNFGSVFSRVAELKVGNPPRITRNLNSIYQKSPYSDLTLSVSASGTNLRYLWYKDNSILNGERGSTLVFKSLKAYQSGIYKVKVSNVFGSIFSVAAHLKVGDPPKITTNLNSNYRKPLGSTLTLSVRATSRSIGLSYQWYKDNQALTGETNSVLKLTNLNSSHAGNYKVKVSNDSGSVFSNIATLVVGNRPTITTNLNPTYNKSPGSTLTFSVSATGTGSLSYQWYKDNKPLNGETNRSLSIANLNSSHAGSYKVEVKNNFGSVFSNTAILRVGNRPTITTNLNSTYEGTPGSRLTLSVSATGSGSLSYQWYKGNSKLNGETNRTLSIANLNSSHAGNYKVEVKNNFGSTYSKIATLVIGNRPTITRFVSGTYSKLPGSTVTFSVSATGTGSLSYQWHKDNKPLNGKTNQVLSIANLNSSHAGKYKVEVKNDFGSTYSKAVTLVIGNRPTITSFTSGTYSKSPGSTLTLSVSATGTGSLSYQWYQNAKPLSGKTNSTLKLTKLNNSHAGKYKVKVSNDLGSVFSNIATLNVGNRPTITTNLNLSYQKSPGSTLTLSVSATGTGSLSYQWYQNAKPLSGKTNSTLKLTKLNNSHAGKYKVKVSNDLGSVFSNIATLSVGNRPTITTNLNLIYQKSPGSRLTLSVSATGTGSLSYQWYKNNKKLNGETNRSLSIANLNNSHAGNYKVKVSNAFGSTYSKVATLSVGNRPTITTNLNPTYKKSPGSRLTLSVSATGTGSLSYQWYKDNKPLNGKTNRSLSIASLNNSHAGNYKVKVSNAFGSTYSKVATLSVGNRPTITTNLNPTYKKSPGSRLTLSISATGTGSLSYQWYKDNKPLNGKTNRSLSIASLNNSHAGNYKVKVSNAFGSTYSKVAALAIGNRPTITTNLNPTYKKSPGSRLTLSVSATGTGSLSYQWYKNNKKLNGETNRSLSIANLNNSHAGNYKVEVKNDFGSTYSREATLNVGNRPTITTNLYPTYKKSPGSRLTLSVRATGTNLSYQWYKNNVALNGKTSSSLAFISLSKSDDAFYKVEVKNDFGSTYSKTAALAIGNRPTITTNLNSTYKGTPGSRLTLSVSATGTGSLSYQWYKGNSKLSGKTNRVLSIANLNSSHAGNYKVEVKNDFGSVFSRVAILSVGTSPRITRNLNSTYNFLLGSVNALYVEATGTNLSYQWYKDNRVLRGETNSALILTNLNSSHAGNYKVKLSNDFGSIFSTVAQLKLGNIPKITRNLNSIYQKSTGSDLTLSVMATTGSGRLSYQWYKDNKKLNGETNSTLVLKNLSSYHGGVYKVHVKNDFATISSIAALLKVGELQITKDLKPIHRVLSSSTLTLSVSATGTNLRYQWYKNHQALNGKTSSSLKLTKLSISQSGKYQVKVSNDFNSVSSRAAQLIVGELQITKDLKPIHRVLSGSTLTLSVSATGTRTPTYQWYKDNQVLNGETNSALILKNLNSSHAGSYRVEVKNDFAKISSLTSQVQILPSNLAETPIYLTPKNLITKTNESFILRVDTEKQNIESYIWYRNENYMATTNEPFYTIKTGSVSQNFSYKVEAVVGGKSYFSNIATVSVIKPLTRNISSENVFDLDTRGGFELPPQQWHKDPSSP